MVKSESSQMIPRFFLYSSILMDLFVGPELEADTVVTGFRAMLEGTDESWRLKLYIALVHVLLVSNITVISSTLMSMSKS